MKKALITGITGQDGAYLAEFLLQKGSQVHGIKRRSSLINIQRIDHFYQDPFLKCDCNFILYYGDMTDASSLTRIPQKVQPDEVYNYAAQSHVAVSIEDPECTSDSVTGLELAGFLRRSVCSVWQRTKSEIYGKRVKT